MSPLNAPATAKRSEEALKCIQEREIACAECTCDRETVERSIKVHLGAREFRVRTMALAMEAETPCTPVGNGIV